MTIAILVVGATTYSYLRQQLRLRRMAANVNVACIYLRSEIISKPTEQVEPSDYAPPVPSAEQVHPAKIALPRILWAKAEELAKYDQGPRNSLPIFPYLLVIIIGLLGIAKTWAG